MLYERLGAPCTQCGRRFQSDEEGRKKKTAHMDWHFRVHQRMTEAEKRNRNLPKVKRLTTYRTG
jgi:pre-mRNA cleavage complex 2 protein Pcf11